LTRHRAAIATPSDSQGAINRGGEDWLVVLLPTMVVTFAATMVQVSLPLPIAGNTADSFVVMNLMRLPSPYIAVRYPFQDRTYRRPSHHSSQSDRQAILPSLATAGIKIGDRAISLGLHGRHARRVAKSVGRNTGFRVLRLTSCAKWLIVPASPRSNGARWITKSQSLKVGRRMERLDAQKVFIIVARRRKMAQRKTAQTKRSRARPAPRMSRGRSSAKGVATSNATDVEHNVFKSRSSKRIAASSKRSAEHSDRRKLTSFHSAMSMLNIYINRARKNLSTSRRRILEAAKNQLGGLLRRPAAN
jgi:Protein of unknown function (DUF3175)